MGLDMYAYTLKKELVTQDFGFSITELVAKHYGITLPTEDEIINMGVKERSELYETTDQLRNKAKEDGIYNHDFKYWRKFNALHGWMEELYRHKGGQEKFNCIPLRLTEEDFDKLEASIDFLTPTEGFFFGSQEPLTEEDKEAVRGFIIDSREAMRNGYTVIYDSWW